MLTKLLLLLQCQEALRGPQSSAVGGQSLTAISNSIRVKDRYRE
jgi:hypothetical protein